MSELIRIPVAGISPILQNNGNAMTAPAPGPKRPQIPSPEDEAEAGCYRLPSRQLYMPMLAFRSCLVKGATGRRIGKTAATSLLRATVFADDIPAPLTDDDGTPVMGYELDVRRCVVTSRGSKAAVRRARPRVWPWHTEVVLEYDPEVLTDKHIIELLDIAGATVGIGNFRPEKGGRYGRFRVED